MGIFSDLKNKAVRKMMVSQMKKQGADDAQIKMISELLEENPELFEKMGKDIEAETKNGKSQMEAAQAVMSKYQADMQKLMMKNPAMMQRMKVEAMKMQRKNR
jgi:hypothetical protein